MMEDVFYEEQTWFEGDCGFFGRSFLLNSRSLIWKKIQLRKRLILIINSPS